MKCLIVILIVLALVASCNFQSSSMPEATIHKGTQGLELDVNVLPAKVFTGERFSFAGSIENKGAAHVDDGVFTVGIQPHYISTEEPVVSQIRLAGKTAALPIGEKQSVGLTMEARELPPATETVPTTVQFTMCYPYTTTASATICVDPDSDDRVPDKPCTSKTVTLSGGQGAPVAVTRIEPRYPRLDKTHIVPQFTITVKNTGKGSLFLAPNILGACTSASLEDKLFDKARIRAFLVDSKLDCNDEISFRKDVATATCTLEDGLDIRDGTYSTLLRVELEYGYREVQARTLQIVRNT